MLRASSCSLPGSVPDLLPVHAFKVSVEVCPTSASCFSFIPMCCFHGQLPYCASFVLPTFTSKMCLRELIHCIDLVVAFNVCFQVMFQFCFQQLIPIFVSMFCFNLVVRNCFQGLLAEVVSVWLPVVTSNVLLSDSASVQFPVIVSNAGFLILLQLLIPTLFPAQLSELVPTWSKTPILFSLPVELLGRVRLLLPQDTAVELGCSPGPCAPLLACAQNGAAESAVGPRMLLHSSREPNVTASQTSRGVPRWLQNVSQMAPKPQPGYFHGFS